MNANTMTAMTAGLGLAGLILILASAVADIYVRHQQRELFAELEKQERIRDERLIEWGRLQLELSTWGSRDRIRDIATRQLDLYTPSYRSLVLVEP